MVPGMTDSDRQPSGSFPRKTLSYRREIQIPVVSSGYHPIPHHTAITLLGGGAPSPAGEGRHEHAGRRVYWIRERG